MPNEGVRLVLAQLDFIGGVNSNVVPIRASDGIPHGLLDSQIAWANNVTMRGGGISSRFGWIPIIQDPPWSGLFQGGFFYRPDNAEPQLIIAVGGQIWRIRTDTDFSVENVSTSSGFSMLADQPQYYFAQAEKWLVIQDGSLVTKPLFFSTNDDGSVATMTQSNGFVGVNNNANQIPPAGPMDYYSQRLWFAKGRFYGAGDIVFGLHGGVVADRMSVLYATENPVIWAGDTFVTPITSGNIRWLKHAANLDTALGETNLFIGTRNAVFACKAPIDRAAWIAATLDKMPLQTVALLGAGGYSERGATPINNDIFFCSTPDGDIRSLQTALRYFDMPGQLPLSNNVNRVLDFNDRALLHLTSSIYFDNRFLQTVLPFTTPVGVAFKGIVTMDFNPLSTLQERLQPNWEGVSEGLPFLQLYQANIGGRDRAFGLIFGSTGMIDLWELTSTEKFDRNASGEARIQWSFETPSYTWGNPLQLKELETLRLWIDRVVGTSEIKVEFRPDQTGCWLAWRNFKICSAKDCSQLVDNPCSGYPTPEEFCEGFESALSLPKPPNTCVPFSNRPANIAYMFQFRITIKGWCRVRAIYAYALPRVEQPWVGLVC